MLPEYAIRLELETLNTQHEDYNVVFAAKELSHLTNKELHVWRGKDSNRYYLKNANSNQFKVFPDRNALFWFMSGILDYIVSSFQQPS